MRRRPLCTCEEGFQCALIIKCSLSFLPFCLARSLAPSLGSISAYEAELPQRTRHALHRAGPSPVFSATKAQLLEIQSRGSEKRQVLTHRSAWPLPGCNRGVHIPLSRGIEQQAAHGTSHATLKKVEKQVLRLHLSPDTFGPCGGLISSCALPSTCHTSRAALVCPQNFPRLSIWFFGFSGP